MSLTYADAHGELVETLDADLRAAVRAEAVDPQRDAGLVRRLAERVVADHDQRSLTGAVLPVGDQDAVVEELVARVSGFGALQRYLDDPTVEEVWINDPSRVFVARGGRHELTSTILTSAQVQELVERMLKSSGRRIDLSQPFVDAMLPEGHRLHVVLEGISRGFSAVNIRKFVVRAARMHDLVGLGSLTEQAASFLDASVQAGLNIVVAGGTQAGQDDLPELPRREHPRPRPGGLGGGGLRAPVQPPRLGGDADPAAGPRGHRRDPAARPGQGEPADAAVPGDRRRGPRRGVPRPAARAERRPARDGVAAREQRPRGPGQDVHAAVAGRGEHLRPVRGADGRGLGRPGRAPRHRPRRRTTGRGDRRGPGPGRERRHRDRAALRPQARPAGPHPGHAAAGRALRAARHRRARPAERAVPDMGAVLGLGVGVGLRPGLARVHLAPSGGRAAGPGRPDPRAAGPRRPRRYDGRRGVDRLPDRCRPSCSWRSRWSRAPRRWRWRSR